MLLEVRSDDFTNGGREMKSGDKLLQDMRMRELEAAILIARKRWRFLLWILGGIDANRTAKD